MTASSQPQSAVGPIDVFGLTHVGEIREVNEDQFFISLLTKSMEVMQTSLEDQRRFDAVSNSSAYLLIVADGVGSVGGGRVASNLAVETVGELIAQTTNCYYNFDVEQEHEFLSQLESTIRRTHEVVRAQFSTKGKGPATTLTMVALVWPRAYLIHVGDSRCYYLHGNRLRQITQDQTMGAMMVDQGVMSEEQVRRSSLDNILSSAIGGEIDPSVGLVDLDMADTLLLCTDGLTKHVSDDRIKEFLEAGGSSESIAQNLLQAALDGGGSDNVTIIVAKHRGRQGVGR